MTFGIPIIAVIWHCHKLFPSSFLTKPLSQAVITFQWFHWHQSLFGFAYFHRFGIIPFSLHHPPCAQQASPWHPLCSRQEEQPALGTAEFGLRSSPAGSSPAISAQPGLHTANIALQCCRSQGT